MYTYYIVGPSSVKNKFLVHIYAPDESLVCELIEDSFMLAEDSARILLSHLNAGLVQ